MTTFPLVVILYIEKSSLINFIYLRGEMTVEDSVKIIKIFGILVFSVPPSSIIAIFTKINFSRHNLKSPLISAILSALFLSLILPNSHILFNNDTYQVAIIYTLSCWIGAASIIFYEIFNYKTLKFRDILAIISKQSIFYALVGSSFIFLRYFIFQNNSSDIISQFFELSFMTFFFVIVIVIFGNYFLVDEALKIKFALKSFLFKVKRFALNIYE
jgi:peptidoglycan biosynthesis protein MviN/MurJ (putative lipid II flippase)